MAEPTIPSWPPPTPQRHITIREQFGTWWKAGVWQKVGLITIPSIILLFVCCSCLAVFSLTPPGQEIIREGEATSTAQARFAALTHAQTATAIALLPSATPKPTAGAKTATPQMSPTAPATVTVTAIATATQPPVSHPTATPVPRQPTATPFPYPAVNNNPWDYNFQCCNPITSPPSDFCSYFPCIASFWNGVGYVEECQDGDYSLSGGRQGSCSKHGGDLRELFAP